MQVPQLSRNISWTSANLCEHGIGVCHINEKSYIFDTGRQFTIKLKNLLDLAWSLGFCCDWHTFDISVQFRY